MNTKISDVSHWVIVLGWLSMGGAERQALFFAKHLSKFKSNKVTIIGLSNPGQVIEECELEGIDCNYWPTDLNGNIIQQVRNVFSFARRLRRLSPTYIAPYCMPANLLCGLVWRLTGAVSCVWQQRDEGRMRRHDWIENLAIRLTPKYISNSEHGAEWLHTELGIRKNKIVIINNGVMKIHSKADMNAWKTKNGVGAENEIICMIANIHQYKDHATLVKAWRLVKKHRSSKNWILVLAGSHEDRYPDILNYLNKFGLNESVLLPGSIQDVADLLDASKLVVFSSMNEGVPNGVLEGMAHGLAIVATDIPGIREALGDLADGQVVEASNPSKFAHRIINLMTNENLRLSLGHKNKCRIETAYIIESMVEKTLNVFK